MTIQRILQRQVETLNEALKIAAMDIAEARASSSIGDGQGQELGKLGAAGGDTPTDSDTTPSSRSGSSGGSLRAKGGSAEGRDEAAQSSSTSAVPGRIFVFQDGTFEAR